MYRSFRCGIHRDRHVERLLVRLERVQEKPAGWALVLELVFSNARATGRNFLYPIPFGSGGIEPGRGKAGPKCAATFGILAPWFLGMVGFRGGVHISLRCGLCDAVANAFGRIAAVC